MAHNLMERNGKHGMFVVGDRDAAWHLLGQRTKHAIAWEEAMKLADLNWTVGKVQLYARNPVSKKAEPAVDSFGIYRMDDGAYLGHVGPDFTPIQNKEAFTFVDTLLEAANGAHYESAGALGNGERIWTCAKVPFDFNVVRGDSIQTYLMFTMAHDGSGSALAKLVTCRPVCKNTLAQAMSENGEQVRIRHTKNAAQRMQKAAEYVRGVGTSVHELGEKLKMLAMVKLRRETTEEIMNRLYPLPTGADANPKRMENIRTEVLQLFESNDNNAIPSIRGTAYNMFNAITEYVDHARSAKGDDDNKVLVARSKSAIFGSGARIKNEALDTILDLVSTQVTSPTAITRAWSSEG